MLQLATDRLSSRMHAISKVIDNRKQQDLAWLKLQIANLIEEGKTELLEDGSSDVDCQHERNRHYYYASLKLNQAHHYPYKDNGCSNQLFFVWIVVFIYLTMDSKKYEQYMKLFLNEPGLLKRIAF